MTAPVEITDRDRRMAQQCLECVVCRRAREKQRGFAFWLVKTVEGGICPYCRAYEKVCGRKAHEPVPESSGENASPLADGADVGKSPRSPPAATKA